MSNHHIPGDYMEQENEWDRDTLLDPAWEKQQKKVGQLCARILRLLFYRLRSLVPFVNHLVQCRRRPRWAKVLYVSAPLADAPQLI